MPICGILIKEDHTIIGSLEIVKDPKLSLRAFSLARVAGFEPAHDGIRIHCLTAWRYPNAYLYCLTCLQMGWIVGFEPTHNGATTRCLNHLTIPTILEATPGFEPGRQSFADSCLTTWLCRRILSNVTQQALFYHNKIHLSILNLHFNNKI